MTHQRFVAFTIDEVRLENYRSFANARLTLEPLTFLVGRNGAGKSNVLDAIELTREALTDGLPIALKRRGGLTAIRRFGAGPDEPVGVAFRFRGLTTDGAVRHAVYGFRIHGASLRDLEERFLVEDDPGLSIERRGASVRPRKLGLVPAEALALPQASWPTAIDAFNALAVLASIRSYQLSPTEIAGVHPILAEASLMRHGENAAEQVAALAQHNPTVLRGIVRALGRVCEGIVGIAAQEVTGQTWLTLSRQNGTTHDHSALQASSGTLRALGILLAIQPADPAALVAIDEVEDALHPGAFNALLGELEAAVPPTLEPRLDSDRITDGATTNLSTLHSWRSRRGVPILLTTHSPEVLSHRSARPERIRVVEWRDGASHIHVLNARTRAAASPIETVGDMLRVNGLGIERTPEQWVGDIFRP